MTSRTRWLTGLMLVGLLAACSDRPEPVAPGGALTPRSSAGPVLPTQTVDLGGGQSVGLYPYTWDAQDPDLKVDPINLVFVGVTDPRQIRAALLRAGGDHTVLGLYPQYVAEAANCQWEDAVGGSNQGAYVQGIGWVGSVIQLACGVPYRSNPPTFRFHLRLFPAGNVTLGGAHFEMNIPNTTEHEVLSWELARAAVVSDLQRAGFVVAMGDATVGSEAPYYRAVRDAVYNGGIAPLKAYLDYISGVPGLTPAIPNSGHATVLTLAPQEPAAPLFKTTPITINMVAPMVRPFCGPQDLLLVTGPVQLTQTTSFTAAGEYSSAFQATGQVDITPMTFDANGNLVPSGAAPFKADVSELDQSFFSDYKSEVLLKSAQRMTPPAPDRGFITTTLKLGPGTATILDTQVHCYVD